MTITNFGSGELVIQAADGRSARLTRDEANRLILLARMHTVAEFVEKLPAFIADRNLLEGVMQSFQKAASSTEKWNLKEKFARLTTLAKGYEPKSPSEVLETVTL